MTERQDEVFKEILNLSSDPLKTGELVKEIVDTIFDKILGGCEMKFEASDVTKRLLELGSKVADIFRGKEYDLKYTKIVDMEPRIDTKKKEWMTFEEFPSLKTKIIWMKEGYPHPAANISFELLQDIQEHCLDKQRVKKTIEELFEGESEGEFNKTNRVLDKILTKLGTSKYREDLK